MKMPLKSDSPVKALMNVTKVLTNATLMLLALISMVYIIVHVTMVTQMSQEHLVAITIVKMSTNMTLELTHPDGIEVSRYSCHCDEEYTNTTDDCRTCNDIDELSLIHI